MKSEVIKQLNTINLEFYEKTSTFFDNSRQYYWDGWKKLIERKHLMRDSSQRLSVLDVGCGNGRFAGFLIENVTANLDYLGLDSSVELLHKANEDYKSNKDIAIDFKEFDLIQSDFNLLKERRFDVISLFGVMHHIPSLEHRLKIVKTLKDCLSDTGILIISIWDFMNDSKLQSKVIDWNKVGIQREELEANDFLLPWDRGVKAYRFCHYLNLEEEKSLLNATKLSCIDSFYADGKSDTLNRYIILK